MKRIIHAVISGLLVAACAGDDDDDAAASTISCRVGSSDTLQCLEYTVPPDAAAATRDGCTAGGGTVVAACPKENRLGTCTLHVGGITLVTHYYSGGLTTDTAQQICAGSGGSWTPA